MSGSLCRTFTRLPTSSTLPGTSRAFPRAEQCRRYAQAAMTVQPDNASVKSLKRPSRQWGLMVENPQDRFIGHQSEHQPNDQYHRSTQEKSKGFYKRQLSPSTPPPRQQPSRETPPIITQHLNGLFPDLPFPDNLATQIFTHSSHPSAVYGHNASLSFLGRRVLESYLLLFLSSSHSLQEFHNLDDITHRTLNPHTLGQHLGSQWGIGRVLRWTPAVSTAKLAASSEESDLLRSVGLYKIQGETVAALIGGIYHEFGGSVAHRFFHTRILPNLLAAENFGLPQRFHADAISACNKFGGLQGPLLTPFMVTSSAHKYETLEELETDELEETEDHKWARRRECSMDR